MSYGPHPWIQRHWDTRAALNFILGGTGAGLLFATALAAGAGADWKSLFAGGLGLIAAGLGAVWLETGRKLRAANVFINLRTSWMARESLVALVVFALGSAALAAGETALAVAAALAGLVFVYCQGRILQASKGIPAWREPAVVPFLVASALAEGAGLFVLAAVASGGGGGVIAPLLGLAAIARELTWQRYAAAIARGAPVAASGALGPAGRMLTQLGAVAPLALLAASLVAPQTAPVALPLAGGLALAAGWRLKLVLITRAAYNQGFALPQQPVRGAR